ncbi:MAG TPA: substrate-binding domain-containing protein [Flexivirga sp.]|uniref:LacI family DNA-binding transcriptional regulator n=1 Tax=Flexivirga sp. TaxID=1962927 RepID=UPI002C78C06D|nr:substrate-binding domain-containing protein [Flexivirga sp.]HWC23582.1 substrate-binding domain-containing protein [Flexivirga sp.]
MGDNVAVAPRFAIGVQRSDAGHGTNPFYEALLAGLEAALDEHGASIVLRLFVSEEEELAEFERWAGVPELAGVVLVDLAEGDRRVDRCRELGLPAVVLGGQIEEATERISVVDVDNSAAMTTAVEFLVGLGHRVLGRVSGPQRLSHTGARTAAFDEAVARAGVVGSTVEGDYSSRSGVACVRELLAIPERPTAIIFDNDLMAVAALEVVGELGLAVPQDVSFLAWDDSPPCRLADPPLSVVSRDVHELGRILASVLLDMHRGELQTIVHAAGAQIVQRGTTARPRN